MQTFKGQTRIKLIIICLLIFAFSGNSFRANAKPQDTQVGGPITSDTVWSLSKSPYIVTNSVDIWQNVTLVIQPGVVVKFDPGTKIQVNGTLIAKGTNTHLIKFTSNQSNPSPGNWGNIEFTTSAPKTVVDTNGNYLNGNILSYCIVEYGGMNVYSAISMQSHYIDHCTVQYTDGRGIESKGTSSDLAYIIDSTIRYNSGGGIDSVYSSIFGNTVENNNSDAVDGGGIFAQDSTIKNNTISNNSIDARGGGISASNSLIENNLITGNSASFLGGGGGIYAYTSTIRSNTILNNFTSHASNGGGIYASTSVIEDNLVAGNYTDRLGADGGGIYAEGEYYTGNCDIRRNQVIGNKTYGDGGRGGGIFSSYCLLSDNYIAGNSTSGWTAHGGGIYSTSSNVISNTITNNAVYGDSRGSGIYMVGGDSGYNDFSYNSVVGNIGPANSTVGGYTGYSISITPLEVHFNAFYGNKPYDVTVYGNYDINGDNNYWATDISLDISTHIHDWYDDSLLGKFLFIPYLNSIDPQTPLPPPINLSKNNSGNSITLTWDPSPIVQSGWGYKVYYDTDQGIPPFEGIGLAQGTSPIDIGDKTGITLNGLSSGKPYYFTVTVYDGTGRESWYSNVLERPINTMLFLPLLHR